MDNIKPADMLEIFRLIAGLNWRELDRNDRAFFADAGPDARIADVNGETQGIICEIIDLRVPADSGLLAIIGGCGLQLELHGVGENNEPLCWTLPIKPFEC